MMITLRCGLITLGNEIQHIIKKLSSNGVVD